MFLSMYYGGTDIIQIVLILGALAITGFASLYIKINYSKFKQVLVKKKYTGFDTAREILDSNGLSDVLILEVQGELSDHYDPKKKVVSLSTDIYHGTSIASVAVAAHECGHALQDKEGYSFLKIRHTLIPFVKFSSIAGYIAIMISLIAGILDLLWVGIALECVILLFQVVTLPVEFNASSRALKQIEKLKIVEKEEKDGFRKMLTSAALTYVASVLSAVMQILRLILIANDRRR